MSDSITKFRDSLKQGVITFQYKKKDGTVRTAKGTTNPTEISKHYTSKNCGGLNGYISYWDMDKMDWRRFNESNLIGILNIESF